MRGNPGGPAAKMNRSGNQNVEMGGHLRDTNARLWAPDLMDAGATLGVWLYKGVFDSLSPASGWEFRVGCRGLDRISNSKRDGDNRNGAYYVIEIDCDGLVRCTRGL